MKTVSQKSVLQQDHSNFFVCLFSLKRKYSFTSNYTKLHEKKRWYFLRTPWFYLTEYRLIRKIEEAIQSNSNSDDFKTWLLCVYPFAFKTQQFLHARYLFALLINIRCSNLCLQRAMFLHVAKAFFKLDNLIICLTKHAYICQQQRARRFFSEY